MLNQIKDIVFWFRNVRKQIAFLKRNIKQISVRIASTEVKNEEYVILLEPWKITPVPMFAITLGILLRIKGLKVKFLINDLKFGENFFVQVYGIKMMVNVLKKIIPSLCLSSFSVKKMDELTATLKKEFYELAFANTVHRNRGENTTNEFKLEVEKYYQTYIKYFSTIDSYMLNNKSSYYIIPGGIFGLSGIILDYAKKNNIKCYSYDAGFGVLLTSVMSVAAHCKDIPLSLDLLLEENKQKEIKFAIEQADVELLKRVSGKDLSKTQIQSYEESLAFDEVGVLIPLNSPWDAAMLRIDYLFDGYRDWLLQTVDLILSNSSHNVTIRQHPDERHWYGKSNLNFGIILKEMYGENPRIQYISSTDKVNTYALLDQSKFVICFSSTFGIEAALRNKKVIVCSDVYYSNFNFVTKPKTKVELGQIINEFESYAGMNSDEERQGKLCFYLGQKCNWLYSTFTPTFDNFDTWVMGDLDSLMKEESVGVLLESIITHVPVSYIKHKRNIE